MEGFGYNHSLLITIYFCCYFRLVLSLSIFLLCFLVTVVTVNKINFTCKPLQQHVIFCLLAQNVMLNDTHGTRRLHPGLPINLHGQGFHCPAGESQLESYSTIYTVLEDGVHMRVGTPE